MPPPKYKICKTCGTRNHPASGQCSACGSRLGRPKDWFSAAGLVLIVLIVIGLVAYAVWSKSSPPAKFNLPETSQPGE